MIKLLRKITPKFVLSWYHFGLAFLSSFVYGFPSFNKKIKVIGITGTNGKSTTVDLATKVLEEAGYKIASFSSIKIKIGKEEKINAYKMTMPGRFVIQRFLKKAVKEKCDYIILEVTSEGIKQYRHLFIDFDVVIVTNVTPEHIESHGSFEKYLKEKGKLFNALKKGSNEKISIVNLNDNNAKYFLNFKTDKKYGYFLNNLSTNWEKLNLVKGEFIGEDLNGTKFKVENVLFNIKLLGRFNIYNSLAAISLGLSQGIDLEICKKGLEKAENISGRMEVVVKEGPIIIIDYAHNPDGLEKVYKAVNISFKGKKICVLGSCGGGRDKWKRKELGKIASNYCDEVIITNEDPYDEDPKKIINDVAEGTKEKAIKILNRREAIKKAISLAKKEDIIIITGKGSEPWMCVENGKKIPWDDRKIAKEEFNKK